MFSKIVRASKLTRQRTLEINNAHLDRSSIILGDPGAVSRVGRKGGTKVFKYGRKSPLVPTLTELFPKIQADAAPDWAQKMLCIIVPNRRTVYPEGLFREFVHDHYCRDHGLSGSCTKEMHAVRKLSVLYKIPTDLISKYCLPEN